MPVVIAHGELIKIQLFKTLKVIAVQGCMLAVGLNVLREQSMVDCAVLTFRRSIDKRAHNFPDNRVNAGSCPVNHGGQVVVFTEKLADEIVAMGVAKGQPGEVKVRRGHVFHIIYAPAQLCGGLQVSLPQRSIQ